MKFTCPYCLESLTSTGWRSGSYVSIISCSINLARALCGSASRRKTISRTRHAHSTGKEIIL